MCLSVCLSVCVCCCCCCCCSCVYESVRSHISKITCPNSGIFCTYYLWLCLSPDLRAVPYVVYFQFCGTVFRSSPGDDLIDWNSGVSDHLYVCSSVSMSTKSFSDFDLIWSVGRPRPDMHTSVTSTQSKVTVKVTELPKLRKLHFSRFISFAVLTWSSKLMVGGDSTGRGLQLIRP